jgi:hypothetical protein
MATILKANKVNLFVSSVLFVFWYHSPNFLDTPRMRLVAVCTINSIWNRISCGSIPCLWGWDSSVSIGTGYRLDSTGIESQWGKDFFANVQTGPGAHPASCTMGIESFPRVKQLRRGAEHPPSSSAKVRKE